MAYEYITEQSRVEAILPELMANPAWGFDSETTGLDPHADTQTLVQIGRPEKQFVIDVRKVSIEPLRPFLESRDIKKVAHYFIFDYKMTKGSSKIEVENGRCTYIGEKVLHAGRKFSGFGLDAVAGERLGVTFDKTLQKSFIGHKGDFSIAQLDYSARDVEFLVPLATHQSKDLIRDGLGATYLLECNAIPAFGDMEYDGMILDVKGWRDILNRNIENAAKAKAELDRMVEPFVGVNLFNEVTLNYNSPDQVVALLNQMRIKVKTFDKKTNSEIEEAIKATDKQTLKQLKDYPIIQQLQKYRSLQVRINTFGEPYIAAINPRTGAIHPAFDQMGTDTGRPSAGESDVNPLNVPRDNEYRNCFIGAPDEVVESDDYSGCESRILAAISNDPKLIEIFLKGLDIHCAVASELYRKEVLNDKKHPNYKLRTPAKSLNFGIAYGMGAGRLYDELNGGGFPCTREEAKFLFNRYCTSYQVAVNFLRGAGRQAAREGYLTNLNGRRRYWILPNASDREKYPQGSYDQKYKGRLSSIEREGGNFMIQSVNADITKDAMAEIRNYRKKHNIRTHFINAIYDEVVTRTHKDDSAHFHEAKLRIMRASAEKWIKTVPMLVDGHAGHCWQK